MRYWLSLLIFVFTVTIGWAQGTLFRYQGQLQSGGSVAQGLYDFNFVLYDANTNGNAIGTANLLPNIAVNNGLFNVGLDFGPVFTGSNYWLSISVRTSGSTNLFSTLVPRQPVNAVPYAIFANSASNLLGTLSAAQLTGTLPSAQLGGTYLGSVDFANGFNSFNGSYSGNGVNITNLNGSLIATGIVDDARLSTNIARLNTNQVFTGINQFTGPQNSFNGAFSGDGSAVTNLNGSQVAFGTVADARLSRNVPLLNTNQIFTGSNTYTGNGYFTGANIYTNRNNSFVGNFFGNGLVGWIPVSGTSTQAISDAGYILLNSQMTTLTLPASPVVGDIVRVSGAGAGGWRVGLNSGQSVLGNFNSYAGTTWLPANVSAGFWTSVACSADGIRIYATLTAGGGIYDSTDAGSTWGATTANNSQWQAIACSADGSRVVAATSGSAGRVFYSTNSGANWLLSDAPATNWFAVACSANGLTQYATADPGRIFISVNGGINWTEMLSTPIGPWSGVACSSDGTKVVASAGSVYVSGNSGSSWSTAVALGTMVASSANGVKLAAASYGGGIYTSGDSGSTWTSRTNAPTGNWYSIASSADGFKLAAVIKGGGVYCSSDGGATWALQKSVPNQSWVSIACTSDGSRLVTGADANNGPIYYGLAGTQTVTSTNLNATITGPQGSAAELQYIGNNQWMPVSSVGSIWAN